mgnify:CR=1 FL=1
MYKKTTAVCNRTGLHARPAAQFANAAKQFDSKVFVRNLSKPEVDNLAIYHLHPHAGHGQGHEDRNQRGRPGRAGGRGYAGGPCGGRLRRAVSPFSEGSAAPGMVLPCPVRILRRKALTSRGGTCYNTLKTSERRRGYNGALPAKQDSRMRSKPYCLNFSF